METREERRSPESQAARALVAARAEIELARQKLQLLHGARAPAMVRRRRRLFEQRLATAEAEERRQLEKLGARVGD